MTDDYDPERDGRLSWLYAIAAIRAGLPQETRTADEIFREWTQDSAIAEKPAALGAPAGVTLPHMKGSLDW